ncbi:hypothetical protein [Ramlibacter sp. AN1133]|uniref:hypothetical protein n=1 Tax=Ramlibacter sp. AN1133 TaxID=3133429 RepID=UPI0030C3D486
MPSSTQPTARPYWSSGRGFASADPERQGEVVGYVRPTSIQTTAAPRAAAPAKAPQRGWMRVQPDVESPNFEGSSSGRWR